MRRIAWRILLVVAVAYSSSPRRAQYFWRATAVRSSAIVVPQSLRTVFNNERFCALQRPSSFHRCSSNSDSCWIVCCGGGGGGGSGSSLNTRRERSVFMALSAASAVCLFPCFVVFWILSPFQTKS